MKRATLVTFSALVLMATAGAQQKLEYADLVKRLTDLEHLATLPEPGEKTAQWSSYDRASKYEERTGKYVRWDANGDGNGVIRREDGKRVLAEMQGPGCLWRIWSAAPKNGHVRIYLDEGSEPAVDLPFTNYFSGTAEPFTRSALVHVVAQGCNNYTPIPYQKSCRIVADEGWGQYYHFVYTTFPKDTQVPTFKRELAPEENAALDEANRILSRCGPREFPEGHESSGMDHRKDDTLGTKSWEYQNRIKGPAAITCLRARFDSSNAPPNPDALRRLILQIRWDGESAASVWAPFGDFFGTATGANGYRSLPCGLTEDGWWYANWFMPFAKSAEVSLKSEGPQERLKFEIYTTELTNGVSQFGRFHAKWHRDEFLPTEIERQIDWPLLKTTGRGRFVGVMLHVWNPRGGWWGEGDEKFFVDGEKFPSTFGTGSEDYFGYAWSSPVLFQHAYHNQTRNDGWSRGHVSVNRWHIADQIPFQKKFDGYIEKYFPNNRPTLYASMAYWYLEPGGHDPYLPLPLEERTGYNIPAAPKQVLGAIEGESLKVLAKTGGNLQPQDMASFGNRWSNDSQLWWTGAKPGDKLELALPVANAGKYKALAQFTRAVDYGIVQLALDGRKLGNPIDLYNNGVVATGELDLGTHTLSAGEHKLTVEITGANAKAEKSYMFGLDYVTLVGAK
jgi:hypothetical protein